MTMAEIPNKDLIFDVGTHKGEDTDFYLKLGYRVVAVEANPALEDELKQRFREAIADGRLMLVDKAIGETIGSASFFVNQKDSAWGTADSQWAARNRKLGADSEEITVDCVRFAGLIGEYGCPHYLKIDVEGADMLCVDALKTISCRPKFISLESTKTSWSDLLKEFNTLETLGYTKFKVVRQGRHKSGHFTAQDGRRIRYTFETDASGPFGEDLDGPWLARRQAILRYVRIFVLHKTIGDNTWWSRPLRRIPGVGYALDFFIVGWHDTHAMRGGVPALSADNESSGKSHVISLRSGVLRFRSGLWRAICWPIPELYRSSCFRWSSSNVGTRRRLRTRRMAGGMQSHRGQGGRGCGRGLRSSDYIGYPGRRFPGD